jgi:SAM-dependent methyltransferase
MPNYQAAVLARVVHRVKRWTDRARLRARVLPLEGPRMGPDGLPLPSARLMNKVAASADVAWFLEGGELAASSMRAILERNGVAIRRLGAILDFGCGVGRVLRHWKDLDGPALHGTDYNPELIAWCAANLPFVASGVNRLNGGLDYPDASFDLVYALSVFTHLAPAGQSFWTAELSRVLKPGGHLFLTTHGEHYLPQLSDEEQARFRRGRLVVHGSRREGSNDCAAFHPEAFVRETLARDLDVVDFVPEGAKGNPSQDAYLLRKPRAAT